MIEKTENYMLDHIGLDVSAIEKSKAFYLQALKPLGYKIFMGKWVGFVVQIETYYRRTC